MIVLKQVIRYPDTNSVEATWVDENDVTIKCHSYDQTQMDMLLADIGGVAGDYQHIFDAVAAGFIPPDASLVAQQRRNEIISRLNQIDILSIRALRAKMTNRGKPADDTKLAALEAEADALRAELATL